MPDAALLCCAVLCVVFCCGDQGSQPYVFKRAQQTASSNPGTASHDLNSLTKSLRRAKRAAAVQLHSGPAVTVSQPCRTLACLLLCPPPAHPRPPIALGLLCTSPLPAGTAVGLTTWIEIREGSISPSDHLSFGVQ
jgi:hypothetical protein